MNTEVRDGQRPPIWRPPIWRPLRDGDQRVLAAALLVGLFLLVGCWFRGGGQQGQLVDVDRSGGWRFEFRVDVNRAEWPELALLPGIGETLARRIVEYRERHGPFTRLEDLQRVRGIGPRTLLRLEPCLASFDRPASVARGEPATHDR